MPDPATEQTNPLDAGHTTTEAKGTKLVVILTAVVAALGTITTVLDQVANIVPASTKWVGPVVAISGVVVSALTQVAYTVMRTQVKVAAIRAGRTVPLDKPIDPATAAKNLAK